MIVAINVDILEIRAAGCGRIQHVFNEAVAASLMDTPVLDVFTEFGIFFGDGQIFETIIPGKVLKSGASGFTVGSRAGGN